ncbi:hypothetical protein FRX31_024369, partial [Thalictrum thalictroides]
LTFSLHQQEFKTTTILDLTFSLHQQEFKTTTISSTSSSLESIHPSRLCHLQIPSFQST